MGELSAWHWLIVIGIAVVLFGAKRLPDAARSLGRSARILRAELGTQDGAPKAAAPAAPAAAAAAAESTTVEPELPETPPQASTS